MTVAGQERTIVRVIRTPDPMGEFGPNSRSGLSTPVRARMSDGNYLALFFHQEGGPDMPDDELIGLTQVQALAQIETRALTHLH